VAGGVMSAILDTTGRVVSGVLLTPIATTAAAASLGFACAAPAAVFQVMALVSATHLSRHLNVSIQQMKLDLAFVQRSTTKRQLAKALATAHTLHNIHQELNGFLQYTSTCTPEGLDLWMDKLWTGFTLCVKPLRESRHLLMQRLETLTRDVIRLAKVTDTNVDVPLAQICFDKALDIAQYLYIVTQSLAVFGAVAAFFTSLRRPAVLEDLEQGLAGDQDVLRASAVQLRDIADTLRKLLRLHRDETSWLSKNFWNRPRYQDLKGLLDMMPMLHQNCRLAAGESAELRFLLTHLPNGKVGVKLLEDDDPLAQGLPPVPSCVVDDDIQPESPTPTADRDLERFLPPPAHDLAPALEKSHQVLSIRIGDQLSPLALAVPRADQFDVGCVRRLFDGRRRPQRLQTSLSCVLALTTGGYTKDNVVHSAIGDRIGPLTFLPLDTEPETGDFPFEDVRHSAEVDSPAKLWQACATITGHAHLHTIFEHLKEVELSAEALVSDVQGELLSRLRAAEEQLIAHLQQVQRPNPDRLAHQYGMLQAAVLEGELCEDMHFIKGMCDECLWACCEEASAVLLNPEKLQALLGQFQFLWNAHILLQRCSCVQALAQMHWSAAHAPQRLPIVFTHLLEHDQALAHCIGVLHTVSSYLQQALDEGATSPGLVWWQRVWTSETRRKSAKVAEMWRQVCEDFNSLHVDLLLEQLPSGALKVAMQ